MLSYFADPSRTLYLLLGAIVIVLGLIALRRQKRSDLINLGIGALVLLVVFLIDRTTDSPREAVGEVVTDMARAAEKSDYDAVFQHMSESFDYKGKDKKAARQAAEMSKSYFPEGIRIWGVSRERFKEIDASTAEQEFDAQFVSGPQTRHRCVGVFKKEGDAWKLKTFRLYSVVGNTDQEVTPPGL
ncbi:MAG TPA: hypothetical protein VM597_27725 [Gemmataceae bacterium]|nr:hypothetical protein [Gemmataceae bacterium]